MPTPFRRGLRHARRWSGYALALALVVLALLVGIASQLLPLVERHPGHVAAWLSARAGRPVRFDHIDTRWTRRGPLLQLDGLRIGDAAQGLRIGKAELLVSMYAGLLPGHSLTELRLRGLSLALQRGDDGAWSVRGLPASTAGDPLESLEGLGELQVIGARLTVDAPELGMHAQVPRADLRLRVEGSRVRAGARGWIRADAAPLALALDFDRRHGDGRAYLEARPVDLAAWAPLLRLAGVQPVQGRGRARVWVQLRAQRIAEVVGDLQLQQVALAGAAAPGQPRPKAVLGALQARLRWQRSDGGWRLDAPQLRIGDGGQRHVLDGLLVAGGQRYALRGERLDVTPLVAVAALSDRLSPSTRRWLLQARPRLRLGSLWLAGTAGGALQVHGHLDELAFAAVADAPGVSGVRGGFEGDAQGFALRLTPTLPVRFDWPRGFGVVHEVHLNGSLVGWRQGAGWRIETPALRVQGTDYAADVRGGLWFQGDGTRPWINLAAKLDDAPLPVAKKFWVHSKMPRAATDWLDMALAGGTLVQGQGLVVGDLDDWPFAANDGRFEAGGHIVDGQVRFQRDWPAMEKVDADVAFVGNGFSLQGRGAQLGQVPIGQVWAGIEDFAQPLLKVRAEGAADAARFVDLLKHSPLHETRADVLDHVQASGLARATFVLDLPMGTSTAPRRLGGTVELRNARLADPRWGLAFDGVHGKADYSDGGFDAAQLQVVHLGQPGQLALRAGDRVRDPQQAFEAELSAQLAADDLLDRAPVLAWLKPYVEGRSPWTIAVTLPKPATPSDPATGTVTAKASATASAGVAGHLHLHSTLVGTALDLPAPLAKPAPQPLTVTVDSDLPMDNGQVDVVLGELLALRARSRDGQTGVIAQLGAGHIDQAVPASGWAASGHAEALDALGWIALAQGKGGAGDLPMRQVDVRSDRLLLLGGAFADTRLQMRPAEGGLAIEASGPALAGRVSVPDAPAQAVSGHFQRAWWQAAAPAPVPAAEATPRASGGDVDPAGIPPLSFDVDDLRLGQAQWGKASLRTQPLPSGLHVRQLTLRSPKQQIDASARWTGRGEAARSQIEATADSHDLGQLSNDLGIGGQVRGGQGKLQFNADWPGSPMAFGLAQLQGSLSVQAENGQLLEVEPGAGRLLGLVSVAQLPRRMMLDFRDFFSKGLAFNQAGGTLRFADGKARSDDLHIDGPAVKIAIHGSVDLRAETFDQTVDVNPKSGNLLTVVGAVAGGPVGAAVGAAANAVLGKPLGALGARTYHVTGPWKDPKVEVIEREPREDNPPAPSSATAPPVPGPQAARAGHE